MKVLLQTNKRFPRMIQSLTTRLYRSLQLTPATVLLQLVVPVMKKNVKLIYFALKSNLKLNFLFMFDYCNVKNVR
jgi:hypothetical protein